jgi:ATP-dependent RNA helicase DeaD
MTRTSPQEIDIQPAPQLDKSTPMALPTQIPPALAQALDKKGYSALTEVQEAVIASDADGADMLVSAQTGSGKTVAFGLAIAPTLLSGTEKFQFTSVPLALVVAPTRELALQVQRELVWLFGEAHGRIASCVGGMDPRAERKALQRGCHIVVGTPGRLRDHIERGALDMSGLRAVVLDEADEMLDFGFREDLEFILDTAPANRRTLMFSATVPRTIANMAKKYQKDALRVSTVGERAQHGDISYKAMAVAPSDKENAIINVLRFYDAESAIVFCKTRQEVNRLSSRFGNRGFSVVSLSGELSQNERTHALQAMRDGRARVCIATDVAARGIDLPGLELVVHADLPTNSDVLKHRSGRTGRAGKKGICALVVPHTMRRRAARLLQGARVEAEWVKAPSLEEIKAKDTERLLSDPSLTAQYDEAALTLARQLLDSHGAEQVAAAFLQRAQAEMPAAEELLDAPAFDDPPKDRRNKREPREAREPRAPREDFGDSVWFSMTAGRKENAEPRWLLPIICRLGHITKREVGSIKIGDKETRFEIKAKDADRFMEAVVASGGGEKSIRISRDGGKGPAATKAYKKDKSFKRDKPKADAGKTVDSGSSDEGAVEAPSDESWVPTLDEMERPKTPSRPRTKASGKPVGKAKKKEKWSRAKKNEAKKKRADVAKRKKNAEKPKDKPSDGDQPLRRSK